MIENRNSVTYQTEMIDKQEKFEEFEYENEDRSRLDTYLKMCRGYIFALFFAFFTSISDILIKFVKIYFLIFKI